MTPSAISETSVASAASHRVADVVSHAPFVCGTSSLGNLYREIPPTEKLAICRQWFEHLPRPVVIDTAGRYGAGMALSEIGRCLREIGVDPKDVVISNKLGWRQKPLVTEEPTFEPGIWKGMTHDAEQAISYQGILDCWREGCDALGDFRPRLASLHDPDEFLDAATSAADRSRRMDAILDAYRALFDLKRSGEVAMIGVGAKDWDVIREIDNAVELDWVMFATLLTVARHPHDLLLEIQRLADRGVVLVNAGVFHSGFLVGGDLYDYRPLKDCGERRSELLAWRASFESVCAKHHVAPASACVQFAVSPPGVATLALNCDTPQRVKENRVAVDSRLPPAFWNDMKSEGLIAENYPWLGDA